MPVKTSAGNLVKLIRWTAHADIDLDTVMDHGMDYYNRKLEPIDPQTWAREFGDFDKRRIDETILSAHTVGPTPGATEQEIADANATLAMVHNEIRISTVFLGIDHSFGVGGRPILFETMAFGGVMDGKCERYATEEEARAGHADMVAEVRKAEKMDPT